MRLHQRLKKLSVLLIAVFLLFSAMSISTLAVTAHAVTATTSSTVKQGNTAYAYVYIDSTEDLASLEVTVHFDPTKVKVNGVYNSIRCTLYDSVTNTDNIQFSYLLDGVGTSTKTQLFYFQYQVLSNAEVGNAYFDITIGEACDTSLNDVAVSGSRCNFAITETVTNKSCSVYGSSSASTVIEQEFTLNYRFSTYQIASGTAVITYDPELFEVVEVKNGEFLTDKVVDINTDLTGEIYVSFVGTQYYSNANFLSVTFRTIKNVNETSKITFKAAELIDKALNSISCNGYTTNVNVVYDETYADDSPAMRLDGAFSYENKQITLQISLEADSRLGAGDFVLAFDPELVSFHSCTKGFAPDFFNIDERDVENGNLKFHIISLSDIVTEETVLTVVFDVKHPYNRETADFTLDGSGLTDSLTESILLNFVDDSVLLEYQVVFRDADGTILQSGMYHYGDTIQVPDAPTKESNVYGTYTFSGWDKQVMPCTADVTYTATYTLEYTDYTVTFQDWDGTELLKQTYHYGDAIAVPTAPVKAADNTYTYTFAGWDTEVISNCAGDATYTATYAKEYINYTVVFKDWNGTVLSTKAYHWGDKVIAPADPTKAADNTYTYTFDGWDQNIVNCAGNATYTATYTPVYVNYTVVFKDSNGTVLSTKAYHWGDEVTTPTNPTKVADSTYIYTFAGWDTEVVANCAGNATYTATYTSNYIDYTVVFKDWDGTVISAQIYHWGDKVTIPANPIKSADNTYTYAFAGWDTGVAANCAGNATYTAIYAPTYINYTIVFKNWNGTVLSTKTYHYGDNVIVPADPSKSADNTYTYIFAGWDKDVVNCAGNATYTATYESTYISYMVTFKDWNDEIISTKTYHWGDNVTAPANPTRQHDQPKVYRYVFDGWNQEVVNCAGNATYIATYSSEYIDYTVVFKNWNGAIISTETYHWGDKVVVPADPTKTADNTYTYAFAGWDKTVVDCAGDATYTATYSSSYIDYTVVFKDWNSTVLSTKTYHYGDKVTIPTNPSKAADNTYTYTFKGWDKTVVNCAGNATYTATYTPSYINYTVVFKNWNGTVLSTKTYHWGDKVTAPADPTKPADNTYTYVFAGWDKDVVNCAGNATYTATYAPTYIDYTVVFKDWDGTILSSKTYHWGDIVIVPANPTRPYDEDYIYTFAGWDKAIASCSGDAVYTATYSKTAIAITSIAVTTKPAKLTYVEGDAFDKTGMVVTAYYNNNTNKAVTGYTISGYTSTVGTKTVTVTYEGKTAAFAVTVNSKVPSAVTSSAYTISGGSVSKISVGTTVKSLLSGLNEGSFCKVYSGNTEVTGSATVGTGMLVKIMDGNTVKASYTIIVTGDTNGDGKISVTDMLAVKAHVLKKNTLSGASAQAADTSGDKGISITDFIQMKAQILGKSNVAPRAVNASAQQLSTASVEAEASVAAVTTEHTTSAADKTVSTLNYIQVVAVVPDKKSLVTL